ncbi:RING-H2 finger protein ATL46 [Eutrema salsugineum]|uniref:RING-H2 finger protein ATL46 n=1 Tax=Eutrema salsugineum TaxID=72664 RepID=UPI000CED45C1|nr:RING-H2 finger protein ATL46 [Eutrema salsugineum]
MSWVRFAIEQKDGSFAYPPPLYKDPILSPPSPPPSGNRISPAVLFVIVILAVLFFISGLLHLLVRFLVKHPSSAAAGASSSRSNRYPEISTSDALQRQLQQLFHLNDSGLDQAFIDALPVFHYKEMVGASKEPFDCAVCLCEFTEKDKLRLLPTCSHAFHLNCIDTWLQSNSTCPLCRSTLFSPGFSMENPMFDFDDAREDEECVAENGSQKTMEIQEIVVEKGVLPVRLGKFKRLDNVGQDHDDVSVAGGETSSSNLDARRCFSMGSYQYILGNSELKVPFCNDRPPRGLKPQDKESEQRGNSSSSEEKKINSVAKGESFSVSKIWLWPKKDKFSSDAQRRLPSSSLNVDDLPKLPWMEDHKKLENDQR